MYQQVKNLFCFENLFLIIINLIKIEKFHKYRKKLIHIFSSPSFFILILTKKRSNPGRSKPKHGKRRAPSKSPHKTKSGADAKRLDHPRSPANAKVRRLRLEVSLDGSNAGLSQLRHIRHYPGGKLVSQLSSRFSNASTIR